MAAPDSANLVDERRKLENSFHTYVTQVTPLMIKAKHAHVLLIAAAMQSRNPEEYARKREELRQCIKVVEKLTLKNVPELMDGLMRMSNGQVPLEPPDALNIPKRQGIKLSIRESFETGILEETQVLNGRIVSGTREFGDGALKIEGQPIFYLVAHTPEGKEIPLAKFYYSSEHTAVGYFAIYPVENGESVPEELSSGSNLVPTRR